MITLSDATNENERLTLQLIRAIEAGDLPKTAKAICTEDFVWTNSGFKTITGQEALWAHMEGGGFASEVAVLATMTHFSVDLIHMASRGHVVFTERIDHHWDKSGRDLMTPHICGVTEIRDGRISAFRDFFDTVCFQQTPTEQQAGFDLESFRLAQGRGEA